MTVVGMGVRRVLLGRVVLPRVVRFLPPGQRLVGRVRAQAGTPANQARLEQLIRRLRSAGPVGR
jgi:hypothetical protein